MWKVLEHRRVDRQLRDAPREVLVRYEQWKDIVRLSDPTGLRLIKGFRDEAPVGTWVGYRSSRLGMPWRVIYSVRVEQVQVLVVSITPHDHRRL